MRVEVSPEGSLLGSKCGKCGQVFYPKKVICPRCLVEGTIEKQPLSKRGRLYSCTVSEIAPPGFVAPYAFGYIDLPEKVRMFGRIVCEGPAQEKLKAGMELEIVLETVQAEQGPKLKDYFFRPVGD